MYQSLIILSNRWSWIWVRIKFLDVSVIVWSLDVTISFSSVTSSSWNCCCCDWCCSFRDVSSRLWFLRISAKKASLARVKFKFLLFNQCKLNCKFLVVSLFKLSVVPLSMSTKPAKWKCNRVCVKLQNEKFFCDNSLQLRLCVSLDSGGVKFIGWKVEVFDACRVKLWLIFWILLKSFRFWRPDLFTDW